MTDHAARTQVPLTPATFHVLLALAEGDKHGYAILKAVRRLETGITLNVGTLYAVLKRLEEDGLIEESARRPDPALDDERRRYYRVTPFGRKVAGAEAARLEQAVARARAARLLPAASRT